ncbi:hypothetical protein KY290_038161 [Solanum tuberosum]|uniref:Ubiquitin-protein ligase n=1 Tax=Solanum tuberosum TaxID=4113 RepID=A0ABQ7TZA5_SOLTU|nr:hypothetical protein KY290_038161 [Solanum tuberosum]
MPVCKTWKEIFSRTCFIEQNFNESKSELLIQSGYVRHMKTKLIEIGKDLECESRDLGLNKTRKIHSSCDGFVLMSEPDDFYFGKLRIINPATKFCITIPGFPSRCQHGTCSAALVFDSSTEQYKVVHIVNYCFGFEIFNLSNAEENWKWERVDSDLWEGDVLYFSLFSPKEFKYFGTTYLVLGDYWYTMSPNESKCCRSLIPDVLSNLPDNVIDVILMCLPCKDAVRTSILSKKWRYKWCRRTEFTLDKSHWVTKNDLLHPTIKFKKIICQFLTLHEGPITKFTLDIVNLENSPEIDNFIYFLSRNGIQHLVLHLSFDNPYKLPSSLFTCSQLRHLSLHNCSIHHSSAFKGFNRLISLELCEVIISSELLESLIYHCPLLEQLMLVILENLDTIEINVPTLRTLDFTGYISSICLKNAPRLVKLSLEGRYMEVEDLDFAKVFESCSALEHLLFDFSNFEFYAEEGYEVPTRLPFDLNSVKRFNLPYIMLIESYKLSYAFCLIKSFPYLEYLEIQLYSEDEEDDRILECLELQSFSDVTFNHLREVKLKCFGGTTPEMQLIKLLLAKSPVLVRMLIDQWFLEHGSLDTRLRILNEGGPKVELIGDAWSKF